MAEEKKGFLSGLLRVGQRQAVLVKDETRHPAGDAVASQDPAKKARPAKKVDSATSRRMTEGGGTKTSAKTPITKKPAATKPAAKKADVKKPVAKKPTVKEAAAKDDTKTPTKRATKTPAKKAPTLSAKAKSAAKNLEDDLKQESLNEGIDPDSIDELEDADDNLVVSYKEEDLKSLDEILDEDDDDDDFAPAGSAKAEPKSAAQSSFRDTASATDSVKQYLSRLSSDELLVAEKEMELSDRYAIGTWTERKLKEYEDECELNKVKPDKEILKAYHWLIEDGKYAREIILRSNLRLVVSRAKHYLNRGLELVDLIQEGNMGLSHAVDKFEPLKGYKFSTYACWWINQAITRGIANRSREIRVPVHVVEQINKITKFKSEFAQKNGRIPTMEEISEGIEMDVDKIEQTLAYDVAPTSTSSLVGEEGGSELGSLLADQTELSPDEKSLKVEKDRVLQSVIDRLDEREGRILSMRYGLGGYTQQTYDQIAQLEGLTSERIRQILNKSLAKMKHPSLSHRLANYSNI